MNKLRCKPWLLALLLLLFAAQWAVPVLQVIREEAIRRDGAVFRLALRPVDPYDIMRGRYLTLLFKASDTILPVPAGIESGGSVYAVLQTGANGLADIVRLSASPEANAFAATLETVDNERQASVNIPLTRFYLPEDDAIMLDGLLSANTTAENTPLSATLDVRLKDGRMVADSLWLDDRPYREWLADYISQHKDTQ